MCSVRNPMEYLIRLLAGDKETGENDHSMPLVLEESFAESVTLRKTT